MKISVKNNQAYILRNVNTLLKVFISCLIAYLFSQLNLYMFKDLSNYIFYINNLELRAEEIISGGIVFYEPLFYSILYALNLVFNAETIIRIIIFFNTFSICFFCLRNEKNIFIGLVIYIICFLQPQVFALQQVTIRQGIGVSIILWLLPKMKSLLHIAFLTLILGLIHNSFFIISIFVFIYIGLEKIKIKKFNNRIILITLVGIGFNFFLFIISDFITVKQSDGYAEFESSAGGGAFVFWTFIFVYFLFFKKDLLNNIKYKDWYIFTLLGLIIYITSYFLSPIAGRLIGVFVPLVIILTMKKKNVLDFYFLLLIMCINIYIFFNGGAEGFMLVKVDYFFDRLYEQIFY